MKQNGFTEGTGGVDGFYWLKRIIRSTNRKYDPEATLLGITTVWLDMESMVVTKNLPKVVSRTQF